MESIQTTFITIFQRFLKYSLRIDFFYFYTSFFYYLLISNQLSTPKNLTPQKKANQLQTVTPTNLFENQRLWNNIIDEGINNCVGAIMTPAFLTCYELNIERSTYSNLKIQIVRFKKSTHRASYKIWKKHIEYSKKLI